LEAAGDRFGSTSPRQRAIAVLLTGAVHILALLIALISYGQAGEPVEPVLTAFDVPLAGPPEDKPPKAPQPREVPPLPPQPIEVPPPLIALPEVPELVMAMLEQADADTASGGCDLTTPIQAALRLSPDVQRELPTIPARRRSVANAIAVWNQTWVEADADFNKAVLESIRTTVTSTIAAASEACRLQPQGGPRLIYLPGEADTVLALGSGEWTWQQVADSAQMLSDTPLKAAIPFTTTTAGGAERFPATGTVSMFESQSTHFSF
jgi:hypothetical protein